MIADERRMALKRLITSIGIDIRKELEFSDNNARDAIFYIEARLLELCICYGFILKAEVGNGDNDDS